MDLRAIVMNRITKSVINHGSKLWLGINFPSKNFLFYHNWKTQN